MILPRKGAKLKMMKSISAPFARIEKHVDTQAESFQERHPVIASAAMLLLCPALMVGVVLAGTALVMMPVSFVMGWL